LGSFGIHRASSWIHWGSFGIHPASTHPQAASSRWKRLADEWKRLADEWMLPAGGWTRLAGEWTRLAGEWTRLADEWMRPAGEWKRVADEWKRVADEWMVDELLGGGFAACYRVPVYQNWGSLEKPMKDRIKILACVLALAFGVVVIFRFSRQSYQSSTFAGPEYQSLSAADSTAVCEKLSRYLGGLGFHESAAPSEWDARAGVHMEGDKRLWFSKQDSRDQTIFVYVDVGAKSVRTSIKWQAYGTERKRSEAQALAYSKALELDGWFEGLEEPNRVSPEFREAKRQDYKRHLSEIDRS
jgi:hypothetical protein